MADESQEEVGDIAEFTLNGRVNLLEQQVVVLDSKYKELLAMFERIMSGIAAAE